MGTRIFYLSQFTDRKSAVTKISEGKWAAKKREYTMKVEIYNHDISKGRARKINQHSDSKDGPPLMTN